MKPNEECWVLKGKQNLGVWGAQYDKYSIGQPARVAFDYEYVWAQRRKIVGWLHTHPSFPATPSHTDDTTMYSWVN